MGGVTPRRGCRVGLSFSVKASVTLMRICLRLLLSALARPSSPCIHIDPDCSVWFEIRQKLKNAPDSL